MNGSGMRVGSPRSQVTSRQPRFSPPRTSTDKEQLIEKLVHDNTVLMKEVAQLDEQARHVASERDALQHEVEQARTDQQASEQASSLAERAVSTMEEQLRLVRQEREEMARQHATDKEFLSGIFRELEVASQLYRGWR